MRRKRPGGAARFIGIVLTILILAGVVALVFRVVRGAQSGNPAATAANRCPLTGAAAPSGSAPSGPAVAVVIGNDPAARPQSGLGSADIVFEVQAEGGITRFVAVYQCHRASAIGPVRSVRWVDLHVVEQLSHPILAFAGGIIPDRRLVASSGAVSDADLLTGRADAAGVRSTSRVPPENLYTSTSSLRRLFPTAAPPSPIFSFSSSVPPGGSPAASASIPYSAASQVHWTWSPTSSAWLRSYGASPAATAGSGQVSAANVVIESVPAVPGPYNESGPNSLGVHSITVGTGPVVVLRNGEAVKGTWARASYASPTQFVGATGQPITLTPGNTWVEIVPNTVPITVSP
ncbi:MAG: DUF3048 domain-containing protein [Acidimicrobiales bacterium]